MNRHTLPLARALDPAAAGAKAATLAVLLRAGLGVPDGFVLTPAAHAEFLRALPGGARAAAGRDEAEYVRVLRRASWPAGLAGEVAAAHRELLPAGGPVAVRSSGTVEDGAVRSFAGQFTTVLDVRGIEAVRDAVLRCWAAVRSERVRRYRGYQGSMDMAVLVQHMVPARWSGVLFSTDPLGGGAADSMLVEAVPGLPDKLCDGSADPVRFRIDRKTSALTTAAGEAAGAGASPEPPPGVIRQVGRTALEVEEVLGRPVDMEWAVAGEGGRVQILQARPITRAASAPPSPPSLADLLVNLT